MSDLPYKLIYVSTNMTAKMIDIPCISSSCLDNLFCLHNQSIINYVCYKCYSKRYLSIRPNLRQRCKENGEILSSSIIPTNQLPFINALVCRFESFGDIINDTHLINYINICLKNKCCNFALWTKRADLLIKYFSINPVPNNLIIVYSSPILGVPDINTFRKLQEIINPLQLKLFTVYPRNTNVEINCKDKCKSCLKCYTKYSKAENNMYISELIK